MTREDAREIATVEVRLRPEFAVDHLLSRRCADLPERRHEGQEYHGREFRRGRANFRLGVGYGATETGRRRGEARKHDSDSVDRMTAFRARRSGGH